MIARSSWGKLLDEPQLMSWIKKDSSRQRLVHISPTDFTRTGGNSFLAVAENR